MDDVVKYNMGQAENIRLFKEKRKEFSYIHLDDPGATEASVIVGNRYLLLPRPRKLKRFNAK